jgi:GNAT superfamily N-acetyltransferase
VVATVTAAFAGDPAWAFLAGGEYERLAPLLAGALFDARVQAGNIWVTGDCSAVAMWESPADRDELSRAAAPVWARYRDAAGVEAAQRLAEYDRALEAPSPSAPYWYLGTLATRPERQRRGLATAVIAPALAEADATGIASCLETSTEPNRRFYERRGFTDAAEVDVPNGPPTWWLTRPPASGPRRSQRAGQRGS